MIKRIMILSLLFMNVVSASDHEYESLPCLSKAVRAVHPEVPTISSHESVNLNYAAAKEGKSVEDFCEQQQASLLRCVPGFVAYTCQKRTALLEKKDTVGKYDFTPFLWAACNDDTKGVRALLAAGVNINVQDKNGNHALIFAVRNGNRGMVDFLVRSGADVSLSNDLLQTAADLLEQEIKWRQGELDKIEAAAITQATTQGKEAVAK